MFMPFCCYNSWLFYASEFPFSVTMSLAFFLFFSFLYLAPSGWLRKLNQ